MLLLGLVLLSLSRFGLVLWNADRVFATDALVAIMLQGVRADLIVLCLWSAIPVLLVPLWAHRRWQQSWFKFTYIWSLFGLISLLFMELASPAFIMQYDVRPNRLFIEYLKYPQEVFSTLWHGFRLPFLAGIIFTTLFSILLARLLKAPTAKLQLWSATRSLLVWPVAVILVFAGIRSTTDHRPANPALFAITADAMVNSLVISSGYSVLYAIYSMKHEARSSEMYGKLSTADMLQQSLDWPWLKTYQFANAEAPTLHFQTATVKRDKPLNVVIILQESLGATFVQSLGGVPVTPELEKLKTQGIWFENLYATGTRSVRGIEAVVAGFPPTPAQSVVKLSNSQQNFTTIASVLKSQGYNTQFIYGGEAHFDNMRSFFTGNGIDDIVDFSRIKNPAFVGSWGASDEDLFNTAHQQLLALHQQDKPFFSLIFTSSNHEPFEFPDNRITMHEQPKNTVNNAVKYADWAMGKFFETAKNSDYWQDTLFLVVADHDNRVYGNNLIPVEKFRIPGLILGADVTPEVLDTLSSQIDLAPTLLSMAGVSACHTMIGRDLTLDKTSPGRAILQFENYFALMQPDSITILKPNEGSVLANYQVANKKLLLSTTPATKTQLQKALAQVQLPSYLYRERKNSSHYSCAAP
ncbi:MAG: LTA synthase family protein [Gammaproteobacteria bacterium]|nr:LTA synthase family protein [Gammaproteobacteria bacterium]